MNNLNKKIKEILSSSFSSSYLYRKYSYSQEGEDMIIQKYFSDLKIGFYVDLGAFHPYKYSNTFLFYKLGWKGINIEPNIKYFRLFKKYRKRDLNLNVAVSNKGGSFNYYQFKDPALNTLSKYNSQTIIKSNQSKLFKINRVKVFDIDTVLDKYVKNKFIHFINIDCEGLSFDILQGINFNKYSPKMIVIEREDMGNSISLGTRITHYMSKYNYHLYACTSLTNFYVKLN